MVPRDSGTCSHPVAAVPGRGSAQHQVAAFGVLAAAEVGQQVLPSPAGCLARRPGVVDRPVAADMGHRAVIGPEQAGPAVQHLLRPGSWAAKWLFRRHKPMSRDGWVASYKRGSWFETKSQLVTSAMVTSANLVSASARRREHDRNAQWTSLDPDARFDLGQRSTRTQWLHGRLPCVIVGLNKAVTLADCHGCGGPRDFSPKYYCSLAKLTKFRGAKAGSQRRQASGNTSRRPATNTAVSCPFKRRQATSSDATAAPYKRGAGGSNPPAPTVCAIQRHIPILQ